MISIGVLAPSLFEGRAIRLSRYRVRKMSATQWSPICAEDGPQARRIVVYSSASEHLTALLAALVSRRPVAQASARSAHIDCATQWLPNSFVPGPHCLRLASCCATAIFQLPRSMPRSIETHYEASRARGQEVQHEPATTSSLRLPRCPPFARVQVGQGRGTARSIHHLRRGTGRATFAYLHDARMGDPAG